MDKLNGQSLNLEEKNIEDLKKLFPNVVTEGKIDFEKLKLLLGENLEERNEKYQFTWNGKSKAIKLAQLPSKETLRPSKEDSKNWDTTDNLYIEGDNLEVLKQLQKTYFGKIKMIYIDPPYNTGNNILYKNDFSMDSNDLKKKQKDNKMVGGDYFNNSIKSASFHTEWINIMYSRLILAKNLLSNFGAICIAIDDNELANLIKISDEVFGEDNRLGIVTVVHKPEGRNQEKYFATSNEYALFYCKDKDNYAFQPAILDGDILAKYDMQDKKGLFKGNPLMRVKDGRHFNEINLDNFQYPIYVDRDTEKVNLEKKKNCIELYPVSSSGKWYRWRMIKETLEDKIKDNEIFAKKNKNGDYIIYEKYRITKGQLIKTHWIKKKYNATQYGSRLLSNLMDGKTFDFPKSLHLISDILKLTLDKNGVVLDFFSGSATTAHAVMKLNAEDGGNRKFIMVQLPEKTDEKSEAYKAGYKNICEIGKERIRRAGEQIKQELIEKKEKAGMLDENIVDPESLDIGFKVFK